MTLGQRIRERSDAMGISQAELGRRAGVKQSTVNTLINSNARTTPHLIKLARVLKTSPAYLMGESDDPDAEALLPPPAPRIQTVLLPVTLPSEAALAEMYEAQLRALARLQGAELARALAKRLPKALARLQAGELYEETDDDAADQPATPPPAEDRPAARRARRS